MRLVFLSMSSIRGLAQRGQSIPESTRRIQGSCLCQKGYRAANFTTSETGTDAVFSQRWLSFGKFKSGVRSVCPSTLRESLCKFWRWASGVRSPRIHWLFQTQPVKRSAVSSANEAIGSKDSISPISAMLSQEREDTCSSPMSEVVFGLCQSSNTLSCGKAFNILRSEP